MIFSESQDRHRISSGAGLFEIMLEGACLIGDSGLSASQMRRSPCKIANAFRTSRRGSEERNLRYFDL